MTDVRKIEDYRDFEIPEGSGVIYEYTILSLRRSYIGQTTDLRARHNKHRAQADRLSPYIRHGDYALTILDVVPVDQLDEAERRYIKANNTIFPNGFNVSEGGRDKDMRKNFPEKIPSIPESDHLMRFRSNIVKLDGVYYMTIPEKFTKRGHLDVNDTITVWAEDYKPVKR